MSQSVFSCSWHMIIVYCNVGYFNIVFVRVISLQVLLKCFPLLNAYRIGTEEVGSNNFANQTILNKVIKANV